MATVRRVKWHERLWAGLAHLPIITMIWAGYVLCKLLPTMTLGEILASCKLIEGASLPIAPLFMTVASMPIVLSIRYMQRRSVFVKKNTNSAFGFNVWLLKHYAAFFAIAFLGFCLPSNMVVYGAGVMVFCLSLLCLVQCIAGVIMTARGQVFQYWYPPSLLCCRGHILCSCGNTAKRKNSNKSKRDAGANNAVETDSKD